MKIKYLPYQPHCFAFGGFELQMLNAFNAVNKIRNVADKMDVWSTENDFEILHVWGVGQNNYNTIKWARRANKKIVSTVLLGYVETNRKKISSLFYPYRKLSKELLEIYKIIDAIIVVNEEQSTVLTKYYGVEREKINIIPNIVEDIYFIKPILSFNQTYNIYDYILCTGNICERKNQYNLAIACIKLQKNLVIIGDILTGEEKYGKELEKLIENNKNILWIREMPHGSPELVAAYYDCSCFALVSSNETQPISALEATAVGKPIILPARAYAKQKYYSNVVFASSTKVKDIMLSIEMVTKGVNIIVNQHIKDCTVDIIGQKYLDVYEKLV